MNPHGNKISYRIISVVFFSLFFFNSFGTCEKKIKDFYIEYMQNAEHDPALNDALCNAYMTPELISQLKSYIEKSDVDPIIRAQDVSEYAVRSVSVTSLSDGWYMVRYKWDSNSKYTEIPLKVCDCDNAMKIVYITPIWLGNRYGDKLLQK